MNLAEQSPRFPWALAVTGNAGSGKSTAAAALARQHDALLFNADETVRSLLETPEIIARIRKEFPATIEAGRFSKSALRKLVFSDPDARKTLENILHPEVFRRCEIEQTRAAKQGVPFVAEIPLLFESGRGRRNFDRVLLLAASRDVAIERLAGRPGITPLLAAQILDAQLPLPEKIALSDWVVWNDGSADNLDAQLRDLPLPKRQPTDTP